MDNLYINTCFISRFCGIKYNNNKKVKKSVAKNRTTINYKLMTGNWLKIENKLFLKGMGKVSKTYLLDELKSEIEDKRNRLNELVISDISKNELLKISVELDKLIGRYYDIELNKKRADI